MYQEFFSLKEQPFSISPDPDFLFLSDRHKEALAHLKYGLQGNGGFVLLTGEVGTGKTTVCQSLLQGLDEETDVAFILNPALTEVELLATICDGLNIDYDVERASLKTLFDAISSWMVNNLEKGRNAIVLIDEAQHLSFGVLEQLRLLTNIESNNKKPLQVILIGQTELQQKLKENNLRQLAQRITARYHLLPLNLQETEYYIQHRLNIAGAAYPIFEPALLKRVFKYSRGIPRLINLICDRSMLCAYSQHSPHVTVNMISLAVKEIDLSLENKSLSYLFTYTKIGVLALLVTGLIWFAKPKVSNYFTQTANVTQLVENNDTKLTKKAQQNEEIWFDKYPELTLSNTSVNDALQTLYAVWGYSVPLQEATCARGAAASLQCFTDNASLAELERLNYPATIQLVNEGKSIYVVLYKINQQYEIVIGTQKINVTSSWLQRYWNGRFTILWRSPFVVDKALKFGQKSEQVLWLSQQLNTLNGLPKSDKNRFDWKLKEQVIQFQDENKLITDGIVGQRTLMPLVQKLDPQTPSLF